MDSVQDKKADNTNSQSENAQEDKFVPKKAYEEVTGDMHKFKAKTKDLEAKLTEYQSKFEAIEREKLAEQGKWQELAQTSQDKLEQMSQARDQERSKFVDYHKKQAVISDLGGFKNAEYASFINVSDIQVDENGAPDMDAIKSEADRIRANHPELLKSPVIGVLPPNAPSVGDQGVAKDYSQMSEAEKLQTRRELLSRKQTK